MKRGLRHWPFLLMLMGVVCLGLGLGAARAAESISSSNLHNAFVVTSNIFSGSSPDSDRAFAELVRMGVKTIISVDGAKPDVESARKHGLRYVHLPFGYDGIPTNRVVQLVKAARTVEGPIYVHCHHGKHRGPAAVAIMCEATAGWNPRVAEAWLREAGTAVEYQGLFRNAREFRLPNAAQLAAAQPLKEVEATSSLVETMVAVDAHFDRLKAAQKSAWREIPGNPEQSPAVQATLLWELFRELARVEGQGKRPGDLQARIAGAEKTAEELRLLLRQQSKDTVRVDEAFRSLNQSCVGCHKRHRN